MLTFLFTGCASSIVEGESARISSMSLQSKEKSFPEEQIELNHTYKELESIWKSRIQSFLDRGIIPLIDLESHLKRKDGERYIESSLAVMDMEGIALIAFDTNQAKKDGFTKGYRWGYYSIELSNTYPDRFIPTTNGGINPNWGKQKGGRDRDYIDQLEKHVSNGTYAIMGELEFRHYWSSGECKMGRGRDVDIYLNSENGHRVFSLSEKTDIPFVIHMEPEDQPLVALEEMLTAYPGSKVIVAHFTQIRHPQMETHFNPQLVRHLLSKYPNLYYELSIGEPGRRYACTRNVDTYIWEKSMFGQKSVLDPEYKNILNEFSDRFVSGFDYGGGRPPLAAFLPNRAKNIRLITKDLTTQAKHNIGYRNAWRLLTGKEWN